jgi:hypothetical protein
VSRERHYVINGTAVVAIEPSREVRRNIHSSMSLQPFVEPWPLLQFLNLFITQTVGLLGRVISPSLGCYLHTEEHKHRINAHTDIHVLSRFRTHDPSVRAEGDSSCLTLRCHCARQGGIYTDSETSSHVNRGITTAVFSPSTGFTSSVSHWQYLVHYGKVPRYGKLGRTPQASQSGNTVFLYFCFSVN